VVLTGNGGDVVKAADVYQELFGASGSTSLRSARITGQQALLADPSLIFRQCPNTRIAEESEDLMSWIGLLSEATAMPLHFQHDSRSIVSHRQ
jgi:hypothetical protein